MVEWQQLGTVQPNQLIEARLETHHAAQWLARVTRAYFTPIPDDSHTSFTWNTEASGLMTQPITSQLTLTLQLNPLSLH